MSEERPIEEQAPQEEPQEPVAPEPEAQAEQEVPQPETIDEPPQIDPQAEILKRLDAIQESHEKLQRRQMYLQRQIEREPPQAPEQPAPQPKTPDAPKAEDFDDYDAYIRASANYEARQEAQRYIAEQEAQRQNTQSQQARQQWFNNTLAQGNQMFDDFEVVALANTNPVNETMVEFAMDSERSAELLYYLGRNLTETTAISNMSRTQAYRELAKIEAKLETQPKPDTPQPQRRTVSNAPSPIKPTGSVATISKDPRKMSQKEYEEWRRQGGGR